MTGGGQVARRGQGCPQPLVAQLDKGGQAVGIRHFNPLALTSHLRCLSRGGPPLPGLGGLRLQTIPFLGELWALCSALHSSPFLRKCISYSVCNVDPSLGVRSWQTGCGGGWPPMLQGGAGGGQLHRDFSSQTGRHGAERQSPDPAQHALALRRVEVPRPTAGHS